MIGDAASPRDDRPHSHAADRTRGHASGDRGSQQRRFDRGAGARRRDREAARRRHRKRWEHREHEPVACVHARARLAAAGAIHAVAGMRFMLRLRGSRAAICAMGVHRRRSGSVFVPPGVRRRGGERHRRGHHVRRRQQQRERAGERARGPRASDASQIEREAGKKHVHGRRCYAAAVPSAKRLAPLCERCTAQPAPDARSR